MTTKTMEEKDIKTIQTTKGELQYYRNWEHEGAIDMINPKTIQRYHEIQGQHPKSEDYAVFFAFSNEQFKEGYNSLIERGFINDGDKVLQSFGGMFGTKEGIDSFINFYEERDKIAAIECDPQEVYFYEYNNYESMINYEGDTEAIKRVIDLFGEYAARKVKRYNAIMSIDNIIRKPIEVTGLYYNYNGEKRQPKNVYFSSYGTEVGKCYCLYDNELHPVFAENGEQYCAPELKGLTASYDGKKIHDYRID